jgi:hypothetical protein
LCILFFKDREQSKLTQASNKTTSAKAFENLERIQSLAIKE